MPKIKPHLAIATWPVFWGLYLLFAGKFNAAEALAGAVAAGIAVLFIGMLRDSFKRPLLMKAQWLVLLWRVPVAMLSESWQLLGALLRRLLGREAGGRLIVHPFPGPEDGHDEARRALMTFGVCITPNSYLVFVDHEHKRVLVRQLVGEELSTVDRVFVELP